MTTTKQEITISKAWWDPTLPQVGVFNQITPDFIEAIKQQVEEHGRCAVNFGVTGETMFSILAYQVKGILTQYKFDISRYKCLAYKETE